MFRLWRCFDMICILLYLCQIDLCQCQIMIGFKSLPTNKRKLTFSVMKDMVWQELSISKIAETMFLKKCFKLVSKQSSLLWQVAGTCRLLSNYVESCVYEAISWRRAGPPCQNIQEFRFKEQFLAHLLGSLGGFEVFIMGIVFEGFFLD